jgi:hypothetical protein
MSAVAFIQERGYTRATRAEEDAMRFLMTALLVGLAVAAEAQPAKVTLKDNPEAYWNRGYGCSGSAENYNVTLRVGDVDSMAAKIDAIMTAAGAPSQMGNNNYYGGYQQQRARQMGYSVPAKAADKLAKKLTDMGELMNYSMNRQSSGDTLKLIEERIAVLDSELSNTAALAKMPSATYFLQSRLNSLKQAREVCAASSSKSSISVNLQAKPAETKP